MEENRFMTSKQLSTLTQTPKKAGRPMNAFSMVPATFKNWFAAHQWGQPLFELLAEGGALGMTSITAPFWVEFRTILGFWDYAYVHLLGREAGSLDCVVPMPLYIPKHIPLLLEEWGLLNHAWTQGNKLGSKAYPEDWRFTSPFATPTSDPIWFVTLEQDGNQMGLMLNYRAAWPSTLKRENKDRQLITLLGPAMNDVLPFLREAERQGLRLRENTTVPYSKELHKVAIDSGSAYFEQKLLTPPPGFAHAFMPHAALIGVEGCKKWEP